MDDQERFELDEQGVVKLDKTKFFAFVAKPKTKTRPSVQQC